MICSPDLGAPNRVRVRIVYPASPCRVPNSFRRHRWWLHLSCTFAILRDIFISNRAFFPATSSRTRACDLLVYSQMLKNVSEAVG
jgi:hypothetical protein